MIIFIYQQKGGKNMYMIYCDTTTLIDCDVQKFDNIIKNTSATSIKLNDNVWFLKIEKTSYFSGLSAGDEWFDNNISNYTNENSVVIITKLNKDTMFELPQPIAEHIAPFCR